MSETLFTQADIDKLMAGHRKNLQTDLRDARERIAELESAHAQAMADREAELQAAHTQAIAARETELEAAHTQALATREAELETATAEIATLRKQLASLQDKLTTDNIRRALHDAAQEADAFQPGQLVQMLASQTAMRDGQVIVQVEDYHLSPAEAMQWMRNQPDKFGNLFRSKVIGGIGGNTTPGPRRSIADLDPEQYQQLRTNNPSALGFH
jgi:hypothetical protein